MSQESTDSFRARRACSVLATACIATLVGASGCSSTSPVTGGAGLVAGPADTHCSGVDPIMVSQTSCHPPPDAGAPGGGTDGGQPMAETHFNGEADDDDCKYHLVFTSSPVAVNQNVTLNVTVTKLAENNAPATSANIVIEAVLTDNATHPIPNSGYKSTENPAGSGKYTVTPLRFDMSGDWTMTFHMYESCEDLLDDSPHGHATFHYLVP